MYAMKKGASMGVCVKRLNFWHKNLNGVTKISVTAKQNIKNLLFSGWNDVSIAISCIITLANIASETALSISDTTFANI